MNSSDLLLDDLVGEQVHDGGAVLPPDQLCVLLPLRQELGLGHKLAVMDPL